MYRASWRSVARWTGGAGAIVPLRGDVGGRRRGLRRLVVEQQLVERDVELGGDGVQGADRRVGPPGLDVPRDEAGRDAQPLGQGARRDTRLAQALAHLRVPDGRLVSRWDAGHARALAAALVSSSMMRSISSTDEVRAGTACRRRSSIVASFFVMVLRRVALQGSRRLAMPVGAGWIALTRIGADSQASVRARPEIRR